MRSLLAFVVCASVVYEYTAEAYKSVMSLVKPTCDKVIVLVWWCGLIALLIIRLPA